MQPSEYNSLMKLLEDVPGATLAQRIRRLVRWYLQLQRGSEKPKSGWQKFSRTNLPGSEHQTFFVGSSRGGRMDLVFLWPHPKTGHTALWKQGEHGNYLMYDYNPDVWHPAPDAIPESAVAKFQETGDPACLR